MTTLKSNLEDIIVGVDEVGRGCIAGPVCAGAVVFRPKLNSLMADYRDSKTLTEAKRESLFTDIQKCHLIGLGWASVEEVDELNIRQASLLAMKRAVEDLFNKFPELKTNKNLEIQVDGRDIIPNMGSVKQRSVIKGDQTVRQISAASILAKVSRDRLMCSLGERYSEYSFDKHKGYGTEAHRKAIQKFGVTEHHRRSFGGVKEHL